MSDVFERCFWIDTNGQKVLAVSSTTTLASGVVILLVLKGRRSRLKPEERVGI